MVYTMLVSEEIRTAPTLRAVLPETATRKRDAFQKYVVTLLTPVLSRVAGSVYKTFAIIKFCFKTAIFKQNVFKIV